MAEARGPGFDDLAARRAGAILTIDLEAIKDNYRHLRQVLRPVTCAEALPAAARPGSEF